MLTSGLAHGSHLKTVRGAEGDLNGAIYEDTVHVGRCRGIASADFRDGTNFAGDTADLPGH